MTSIFADTKHGCCSWLEPTLSIAAAAVLHAAIWVAWLSSDADPKPAETPPQLMEVSLIAAQPEASPEPPQPQVQQPPPPPKPEPKPEKPAPKKPDNPKPKPKPKPATRPAPTLEPSQAETPAASAPVETTAAPVQAKPAAPAPAPFVEATYKSPGLNNPPTRYPRIALERRWEGKVTLRVQVLPNGSAGEIRIDHSSGHEIRDEATVDQVKNWRFIPARRGDQAVTSWVIVPVEYKLKH